MTTPTAHELIHVPFRDGEVLAVEINGKPWIVLRPAFAAIGLDAARQIDNVQSREWATTAVTAVVADDGKTRDMIVSDLRTFLMALATIPVSRVAERIRPALIAYQAEVADAIEAYWTRGAAINPRSPRSAPQMLTLDEATAVLRQDHDLELSVVDLTRTLRMAGVLKQQGGPMADYRSWFWFTGSTWNVLVDCIALIAKAVRRAEGRAERQVAARAGAQIPGQSDLIAELAS